MAPTLAHASACRHHADLAQEGVDLVPPERQSVLHRDELVTVVDDAPDGKVVAARRGQRAPAAGRLSDEHDPIGIDERLSAQIGDAGGDVLGGLEPTLDEERAVATTVVLLKGTPGLAVTPAHGVQH